MPKLRGGYHPLFLVENLGKLEDIETNLRLNKKEKEYVMKKNILLLGIMVFSLMTLGFSFQNVDVSGNWELTMQTQRGEFTQNVHFDQEGESLTVTMEGRGGREFTGEGTLKGNDIEWTITRSTPRGEFTSTYTGVVEGDSMSGTVEMGQFGSIEWTAVKK
jgi:hypothetical protein